jgi:hypothetical protein
VSTEIAERRSPILALAKRLGARDDAPAFLSSLRKVAFPTEKGGTVTDEQLFALVVVANQYQLNPFTRELYAFPAKGGGIVPILSVDGWARIINEHPACDGLEFVEAEDGSWVECIIYRKDRAHPTRVREWLAECKRPTEPWTKWPRRMLRHKAMIQCARVAFGFSGIYDPDEGGRIIEGQFSEAGDASPAAPKTGVAGAKEKLAKAIKREPEPEPAAPEPEPASEPEPAPGGNDEFLAGFGAD